MKVTPLNIPDVFLIEPQVFGDNRGFFYESFNQNKFEEAIGKKINFVQDNHSKSVKGVLRGLHYQLPPKAQGKLVRVIQGEVFDVAVDLRQSSPTFGKWVGEILSGDNKKQMWIPEGFAHGFLTLSDTAEFLYKTTDFYSKDHEQAIQWNDETIGIDWPMQEVSLSSKDNAALSFKEATLQGKFILEKAVLSHVQGNGPLGFSLSGGLDSSLIFSLYKYFQPQFIPLAISYAEMEKKEITALKNHFTADYYTLPVPSWEVFQQTHEKIISISEGPLPGPNAIYHFNIYAFAKELGIKIMLSGQGADELFLGYPGFLTSYWKDLYINKKYVTLLFEAIHTSLTRTDLYKPLLQFFKNKKPGRIDKENISLSNHRDNSLLKSNLPYLLHAEDRHSLANNIEARVPFLDSQFLAFARKLPTSYSIHQGKQKWILRAIGKDFLPKSILNNYSKKGFPAKMPEPNQREKTAFLCDLKEFISQDSHFFLPTREPIQLFHQYPALAWRINSLQKWLKIYNIQAT
jgi:dTDP-4-dehydrorhamnose 3,5-epimerase